MSFLPYLRRTHHPLRTFLLLRRCISTLPRPYTFHVGVAYARKPPDTSLPEKERVPSVAFPAQSPKGRWRDEMIGEWRGGDVRKVPVVGVGGEERGAQAADEGKDREHAMGEDFVFVQHMKGQSGLALGIADGVGGWSASGIDPSLFSQCLMFHAAHAASKGWAFPADVDHPHESEGGRDVLYSGEGWEVRQGDGEELGPKEILQKGYDAVLVDPDVEMGASTACVLTLNSKTGKLRAATLGDSGFIVLRGPSIQHIQAPQTHYFNCPKQLSKYPIHAFKKGKKPKLDDPSIAEEWECTLRHGDVVLIYTDGLSDNLFASEMLELSLLSQAYAASGIAGAGDELFPPSSPSISGPSDPDPPETLQAKRLARTCVEHARQAMMDVTALTPFELAAKTRGGWEWFNWIGGKIDDVTVIAVVVTEGM
ncbi:hypothetical protein DACRYDRAFT_97436 [Dacryopinax primogenitus]|uniref:Protein phosphatase n=1 Tax=Dacryopinax primogenitus (strain DJM 731) TaxID=1858805 RepID=M5FU51_DACPD|nr:uncharacterized protein DACRYDRAFT_97436 [Dacryopinax primogenitus]EJT96756.1 hypothetical protein DACRYDRAFT_97436 [Dacryopinax primogenitus]